MRFARTGYAAALLALSVAALPVVTRAAEARLPAETSSPAGLVRAVLESELLGPSEVRGELLKQALTQDPNFAPARWQSGFVRWDGQWLTPGEVASRAARDPLLAEYRKRRDAMIDRADDHRELATWCDKNKLVEQARVHWLNVLEFEPRDEQALAGLDFQDYDGRLLTRQQIEQAKTAAIGERLATKRWQPQIVKWREAIDHGTTAQHQAAVADLAKLSDPAALHALEVVFALKGGAKKVVYLHQLLFETAGRLGTPEATQLLARYAVFPDSSEVRRASTEILKKRPPHTYVPLLIAAIPFEKVATSHELYLLPDGTVVQEHMMIAKNGSDYRVIQLKDEDAPLTPLSRWRIGITRRVIPIRAAVADFEERFERQRGQQMELKNRIEAILNELPIFAKPQSSQQGWQQAWDDYNESYRPPTLATVTWQSFSYVQRRITASCFPAGTSIVTVMGPTAIETIHAGDRVLAQDPRNGELAYKPVQRVTLRPASPLIRIRTGGETLSATRGHPFWVNDKGWVLAKQLKVGDLLHTPNGPVLIDELAEAPAREAYNLVVSDFNSYFAGDRQLLVHDNSPLLESNVRVPGLVAENN